MFDFSFDPAQSPADFYGELTDAAAALVADEPDAIANMANVAALVWQAVPDLNWAGFYRAVDSELVLGPFQGKPACIRIAVGEGVCGAAAQSGDTQRVDDVHAFPGHIACDADSRSELVIPVIERGVVRAVFDLDSPRTERFADDDQRGLEQLIKRITPALVEA